MKIKDIKEKPLITILTPTYNRKFCLPVLYKSLQKQEINNFEWLVIDDGSTDNTKALFEKWQKEDNKFEINYIYQKNGGKHRAINKGVKLAKGELFFIVDSDDFISANATKRISEMYAQIKGNNSFAGISAMRAHFNGERIGGAANFNIIDASMTEIRTKYKIQGDMAEVFRTEILRQYPFPEFEGENFLTEMVVWSRISQKYLLRFFNENLYFCEYLPNGLSHITKTSVRFPQGSMYTSLTIIKNPHYSLKEKFRAICVYWKAHFFVPAQYKNKSELKPLWWMFLFYPVGILFFISEKLKK
ncbi:MAG: glycosyltransferase family 2 protein [Elusimicrobiaceae bacterium]|nr:glycosyltransferase family 2 protein [Elusimicrobiaceae bacterium]